MTEDNVQKQAQAAVESQATPRHERSLRSTVFQASLLIIGAAFAVLAFSARSIPYFPIDVSVERFVQSYHPIGLMLFMEFISWFGYSLQSTGMILLTGILLTYLGLHWEALVIVLGSAAVVLLNGVIKFVVHRPRPSANLVDVIRQVSGFSFPSGHVMFYTFFFGFLFFLLFTVLRRSWMRTTLLAVCSLMLIFVGPSRIYLGAHWPSDVMGAYLIGILCLWAIIRIYQWGKTRYFVREPA
jgi:membrane-associated phospholipid phosphatase